MKSRAEQSFERLVFFSDAVIAIAITLLVLDVRLPETTSLSLGAQLASLASSFSSFFISFAVIGLFWETHHRMFGYIERYDRGLLWLNLLFLLFIAFLPFPTSVVGKYRSATAEIFYAVTLTLTGLARIALWRHAVSRCLIFEDTPASTIRAENWRGFTVPAVFCASIPIAFINPNLVPVCWILLIPISALGRRRMAKDV